MKKQVMDRSLFTYAYQQCGTINPTSLSGLISGVRFREAVPFTFCFIDLYILGFVTDIYYFYKHRNKNGCYHFRKKQSPGHRLFQWCILPFLVCQHCSEIITAPHTRSRDTGSSQFILAVLNYFLKGIFRIREHLSSDKGLCK